MRPTLLGFRSTKEKTPSSYNTRSTYDGRSLCFSSPKGDIRRSSFSHERRFLAYDILARRTGYRVGPGTYSPDTFKDKIKSGSPYKELHLQQKTENNGYYMVGNCLEFEPAMLLGSKKKLQKEKTIAKDSTYAYNRTSRSAATTNNSLIVESGRIPEISKSPQASPRARLRNSVYSKKKGNTPKNKKLNGSMKIGHLLKKRFQ